jgi:hypothetical protein
MKIRLTVPLAGLALALTPALTHPASAEARLALYYRGLVAADSVAAVFVMPGETLSVATPADRDDVQLAASAGALQPSGAHAWRWVAPLTPGMHQLRAAVPGTAQTVTLRAFVMVPASAVRNGVLNGYRIGHYPAKPLRGLDAYRPPRGFVEVTPENQDVHLTPHLQLGQFVTKQGGGFPKYVVLDERLLVKLEYLLDRVHEAGFDVRRFRVLSGYRTPHYNRAIGNVTYSRHVYGAAADIYIDEQPADGRMDDLNRDGRIDARDAAVLGEIVERALAAGADRALLGGVGTYASTSAHGPFVHVDVRGYRASW